MIQVREEDEKKLLGGDSGNLKGDSSDFESDHYEAYIGDLQESVAAKRTKLTERDKTLLSGIGIQNVKSK